MERSRTAVVRSWVHSLPSGQLHSIAWRLHRMSKVQDLSERQEWLWARLVNELELRHQHAGTCAERCWCDLCRSPFDRQEFPSEP